MSGLVAPGARVWQITRDVGGGTRPRIPRGRRRASLLRPGRDLARSERVRKEGSGLGEGEKTTENAIGAARRSRGMLSSPAARLGPYVYHGKWFEWAD